MRDGEGFLLVYSLTERSTFVPMPMISEQIKRVKDTDKPVPMVLVGNKVWPEWCMCTNTMAHCLGVNVCRGLCGVCACVCVCMCACVCM